MKYKLLINSQNSTTTRDFFTNAHDQFICASTTEYWEDLSVHFSLFEPNAYVSIFEHKDAQQLNLYKKLKQTESSAQIPIIVIADEESTSFLENEPDNNIDMIITRPISIAAVYNKIFNYIDDIEIEKQRKLEEERIRKEREDAIKNARKNIVVIDDDKNILKLIKAALEDKYNVTTMINGRMAERFLEKKTCDLIFLDYQMPIENGPEVYKNLRQIETVKDIPIVFLTGVADTEKIAEVLKLKPQGYILKPIDIERLMDTIEKLLNK